MSTYGKDCTPVKNEFAGLINTEHLGCCPYFNGFVGRLRLKSCHKTWQSLRVPCFRCHFYCKASSYVGCSRAAGVFFASAVSTRRTLKTKTNEQKTSGKNGGRGGTVGRGTANEHMSNRT
eukprot:scaffold4172_cov67-Cyclotella_meneghiniana.AAC.1